MRQMQTGDAMGLVGEGASGPNGHRRREDWSRTAGFTGGKATYYNRPMIKRPTWKWFIPLYFYLGGLAGGAAAIGAAADLFGGARHRATVRHARYLTFALAPACAALLIADLGRPTRFHHMFRVFKGSSPLNVGTWILTSFGAASGALAVHQAAEDDFIIRRESVPGRLARSLVPVKPVSAAHGLLGLALGGYTGTLIAATAVPLWSAAGWLMGPLFSATAVASGAAALRLTSRVTGTAVTAADEEIGDVEQIATLADLGIVVARELLAPPRVSEPLRRGLWGNVFKFGAVGGGMVLPAGINLALRFAGPRRRRAIGTLTSAMTLVGALAERFAITEAGKRSADDPLAYQEVTRAAPGEARPTAAQQARRAPTQSREHAFQPGQVVPEHSTQTTAYRAGATTGRASS